MTTDEKISQLAQMILKSKSTVVLTGAGVSTESGIPDFRSKKDGIYAKFNEETFSSILFERDPSVFYSFARTWLKDLEVRQPNHTHEVLAWLEQQKLLDCVITQNIDSLHNDAGSQEVLEIHGHMRTASCVSCGNGVPLSEIKTQLYTENKEIPLCKQCGGVLKPDVVFFGDMLPIELQSAIRYSKNADLFISLGSSLIVHPAATLPSLCSENLAIINLSSTPMDTYAKLIIHEKTGMVFNKLQLKIKELQKINKN